MMRQTAPRALLLSGWGLGLLGGLPLSAQAFTLPSWSCPGGQLAQYTVRAGFVNESYNGAIDGTPPCTNGAVYGDPNQAWQACAFAQGSAAPPVLNVGLVWGAPTLVSSYTGDTHDARVTQDPINAANGQTATFYYYVIDVFASCSQAQFFVRVPALPRTQTCSPNCVGDPIDPRSGNVYRSDIDVIAAGLQDGMVFKRFYNSSDGAVADLSPGWRHSYGRSIVVNYNVSTQSIYPGQSATTSPTYTDLATACVSGFASIKSQVSEWQNATASYSDNTCVISSAQGTLGTLSVYSVPVTAPSASPVEYDVIRDDGQILRFTTQGGVINSPPGSSLRLTQAATGFTVSDEQDSTETYDTRGVLQSIATRAGVLETFSYDSAGRLSTAIDNFGHRLSLGYDTQGRLSTVTRN